MGAENYIFWSHIGSGFEEPGSTPPPTQPEEPFFHLLDFGILEKASARIA